MPDQLRSDFLGCYGAGFIRTPNVDRLAARGVRFGQSYSLHPVCVPARASLLVGQHALRTGVLDNQHYIPPDYRGRGLATWPELLNERGYYTAAIGKMHFYPWDARFGFQHRRIAEDKRWLHIRDDYWHYLHERGERKYHGRDSEGYLENKGAIESRLPLELGWDQWVGAEACRFIRSHGNDGPFAMMVGFPGPHCPYDPCAESLAGIDPASMPEPAPDAGDTPALLAQTIASNKRPWNGVDYAEFTRAQMLKVRAHYAALVQQIDVEVGRILDTLEEQGLADNTVVIFSSDHGDALGDHGLIGKAQFFESAWHVPMIAAGPGIAPAVRDDFVTLTDVTATLLAFGGAERPAFMDARPLPGLGLEGDTPRDELIGALSNGWAVQRGSWRLAKYSTGEQTLFDLAEDPQEQRNRINDPACRAIHRELDAALTSAVMAGVAESHAATKVGGTELSQSTEFGREGWIRPYPCPIGV
jgi:arylsulfatase